MRNVLFLVLVGWSVGALVHYGQCEFEEFKAGVYLEGARDGAVLGYKAGREEALAEGLCI